MSDRYSDKKRIYKCINGKECFRMFRVPTRVVHGHVLSYVHVQTVESATRCLRSDWCRPWSIVDESFLRPHQKEMVCRGVEPHGCARPWVCVQGRDVMLS